MDFKQCNLLALVPCPLKVPFENMINKYLQDCNYENQAELKCIIQANANNQYVYSSSSIYNDLVKKTNKDDLPDVIFSTGLNNLFHTEFSEKFISKGYFTEALKEKEYHFDELGFRDPLKFYTMFSINPLVIVVDLNKKGQLTSPKEWKDLTKECYKNNIILRGHKGAFCETVLLNIFKEEGVQGIKKLSENVKEGLHPSQMAKLISLKKKEGVFIYVMPYFFARTIVDKENVQIIWPDEGALANPVSILVKKDIKEEVKNLAEFIVGSEMGKVFSQAAFPVADMDVENNILKDKKLKWVGWSFIREENLEERMEYINSFFNREI
jgi:ABC-type Fe3+ transport system substrate-binding protein